VDRLALRALHRGEDPLLLLQAVQRQHGDLTCAEETTLGFFAIRYVETKFVPAHREVLGVEPAEQVVLITGQ